MTNMDRIREDHGPAAAKAQTTMYETRPQAYGSVMLRRGHQIGFWDGVRHTLTLQGEWDIMPTRDAIDEMRKGDGSIYHPLFHTGVGDPSIWADCPTCGRVTVTTEGYCDQCTYDFMI